MKIPVLPPDVNRRWPDFTIELPNGRRDRTARSRRRRDPVRAGRDQGRGRWDHRGDHRRAHGGGPFKHLYEFCERVKPIGLNKTALEALVKAGAIDAVSRTGASCSTRQEAALLFADNANGTGWPGRIPCSARAARPEPSYPVLPEGSRRARGEILAMEKEVMGIYVSDHPLRGHEGC